MCMGARFWSLPEKGECPGRHGHMYGCRRHWYAYGRLGSTVSRPRFGLYGGRHAYGRCTAAGAICTEAAMPMGARGSGPCQRRPSDRGGVAICTAAGAIGTEAAMPYRSRGLGLPREGQVTKAAWPYVRLPEPLVRSFAFKEVALFLPRVWGYSF